MSRAFVREDVDPPERSGRKRSASGLPPGAINYMTARGAEKMRAELAQLWRTGQDSERIAELERILGSVEVVERAGAESQSVSFGSKVTLSDATGKTESYRIVGVDELSFDGDAVSWISTLGKSLLASELGSRVALEDGRTMKIIKIE